jgi:hypothetical protein
VRNGPITIGDDGSGASERAEAGRRRTAMLLGRRQALAVRVWMHAPCLVLAVRGPEQRR